MTESFKWKSRVITVLAFIISYASTLTVDQVTTVLPDSVKTLAPLLVTLLAYLAAQLSEEKRVVVAEELVSNSCDVNAAE